MKGRIPALVFTCLMLIIPLHQVGQLDPLDQVLSTLFDSMIAPLSSPGGALVGPMPRQTAMRRVVLKTEQLLESEGMHVDRSDLLRIGEIVERASLQYHLPPSLIFSVIHSESQFQARAMSPDGAIGLMQIQRDTARRFAASAGLPVPTGFNLFDRETNIFLGTGYLRFLIDRFGTLKTALAAYHVGPGEIGRRMSEGEPFSDRYGREIRARAVFYTTAMPVRSSIAPSTEG